MNAQTHVGKVNEMVSEGGGVIREALPEKNSQFFDGGMKVVLSLVSALATKKNVFKLARRFPVPAAIVGVGIFGLYLVNKNTKRTI